MSCCDKKPQAKADAAAFDSTDSKSVYSNVQEYYGKLLQTTKDLKTSACCTSKRPPRYLRDAISKVPQEIESKYYGCGSPLPSGIKGLHVLDLGSGSGRDCYIASQFVGEEGSVTGIDMTQEQLDVAQNHVEAFTKTLGYAKPNLRFVKGYIEFLAEAGIQDNSLDLVISNCVVNLSPNKKAVLNGVWKALKTGGEFYFSDVYADRRLPETVRNHPVLFGECISGALYVQDFLRLCREVGFTEPRVLSSSPITVDDPELANVVGNAKFFSITYRLFKLPQLETLCEDYGQVATYKGTLPEHPHRYALDDHHEFITGKPMLVCGNTASMVGESWLAQHFIIHGDRSVHYGLFDCAPASSAASGASKSDARAVKGACC